LPDTLAVPTVDPPVEQSDGAEDCGPNTLKVIVPDGEAPPDRLAEIDDASILLPAVPEDGALTEPSDGEALATVTHSLTSALAAMVLSAEPR
jgi:hypothetical protein